MMRRYEQARGSRARIAGAMAIVALFATACGSADGATDTTTAGSGDARIDTFEVTASVPCVGKPNVTVPVQYSTSKAVRVQLLVDGREIPELETAGTVDVPVHCDPIPHTFVLIAFDDKGGKTVSEKLLTTELG